MCSMNLNWLMFVLSGVPPQPSPFDRLPTHLALSMRTVDTPFAHGGPLPPPYPPPPAPTVAAVEVPPCGNTTMDTQQVTTVHVLTNTVIKLQDT